MGFEAIHQPNSRVVLFPCNFVFVRGKSFAWSSFRVSASVFSVFFRVIPWLMLLLVLLSFLPSVASLLLLFDLNSLAILLLCLCLLSDFTKYFQK